MSEQPEKKMYGTKNFWWNNPEKYPPEVRREWQRKGGISTGKKTAKNKLLRDILLQVMSLPCDDDELAAELEALNLPNSYEYASMLAAVRRSLKGDVEALRFIRDTRGEKPADNVSLGILNTPVKALDMATLSDDELLALADREDQLALESPGQEVDVPLLPEGEKVYND